MAAKPEVLVKKQIRALLAAAGAYYAMPMGTGYGNSGVPDFLCCVNGHFLAIEAKAGRGTTTALQDKHIAQIHAANGRAIVVYEHNLEALKDLLEMLNGKDYCA